MKKRGLVLSVTAIAMAAGLMAGCTNKQAAAFIFGRPPRRRQRLLPIPLIRIRRQGSALKN